jgi:hypothetical protein
VIVVLARFFLSTLLRCVLKGASVFKHSESANVISDWTTKAETHNFSLEMLLKGALRFHEMMSWPWWDNFLYTPDENILQTPIFGSAKL